MKKTIFIFLISLIVAACIKDKKTSWSTDLLSPIIKSELTISDLLNSNDIVENPDSTLKLIYSTELYSIPTNDLIQFPDTVFEFGASLESLKLPNDTVTYKLTLGEIARAQGGIVEFIILSNHNNSIPITALTGLNSGDIEIDMGSLFESIIIDEGTAEIIITNKTIFTVSNEGFLFLIDSRNGNILKTQDLFDNFNGRTRKLLKPIGMILGVDKIYITLNNGRMIVAELKDGKFFKIIKIDSNSISVPTIFNKKLYIVKDNSIVEFD